MKAVAVRTNSATLVVFEGSWNMNDDPYLYIDGVLMGKLSLSDEGRQALKERGEPPGRGFYGLHKASV